MVKNWWKVLTIVLVFYTLWAGLMFQVPRLAILNETIRALHFHVPMWFGMVVLLLISVVYSIRYLAKPSEDFDNKAIEFANTGVLFGVLGIITGMAWATFTWGEPWSNDPKQNAAAIGLLVYFAYFILRNALEEPQQKARMQGIRQSGKDE